MIESEKWYSIKEVVDKNLLPMLGSKYLTIKWIECKRLKAVRTGQGKGTRYSIKGNWLIAFIAKWESGDFHN
jgi:hypothetical protein